MTGPDHYREGERLAHQAEKLFGEYVAEHDAEGPTPDAELIRRHAEHCREMGALHATLALAAATALTGPVAADNQPHDPDLSAWVEAAGTTKDGAR